MYFYGAVEKTQNFTTIKEQRPQCFKLNSLKSNTYIYSCVSVHAVDSDCHYMTYPSMCAIADQTYEKVCPIV